MNSKRRDYGEGSISQRSDGTWTARLTLGVNDDGKRKVKAFYGKSEREVKKKLSEFKKEYYKNDNVNVERNTVQSYMNTWLTDVKKYELKPKSYDRLEQTLNHNVYPAIGCLQIAALKSSDVQKMINDMVDDGSSYSTIKKAYNAVDACFKLGVIQRSVTYNPAAGVKLPSRNLFENKDIRYYSNEEAILLADCSYKRYGNGKRIYRLGAAVPLILNTGLRLAELLGLKWEDINFDKKTLTVRNTVVVVKDRSDSDNKNKTILQDSGKTERSQRTIPLNDDAITALKDLYDVTGRFNHVICSNTGNILNPKNIDRMFRNICEKHAHFSKEKIYGVHALRHTFATLLFAQGVDIKVVSSLLGHSDISVTYNTYIHVIPQIAQAAVSSVVKR